MWGKTSRQLCSLQPTYQEELQVYIKEHYRELSTEEERIIFLHKLQMLVPRWRQERKLRPKYHLLQEAVQRSSWTLRQTVRQYMREAQLTIVALAAAAQLPVQLVQLLLTDTSFRPSRNMMLLIGFALGLPLDEFKSFLIQAGYPLREDKKIDVVVIYFLQQNIYNLGLLNQVLQKLQLPLLAGGKL